MSLDTEPLPILASEKIDMLVAQAESRNKRIPGFKNKIPHPRTLLATALARAAGLWYLPNVHVEGVENLQQVREILQAGEKVIGASSHKSDGDTIAIQEGLIRSGYPDLAEITGIPAGLKMWERWYIRPFIECISSFPILTPADAENIKNLLVNREKYKLSERAIKSVEKYKENGLNLMKWSGVAMRRFTRKGNLLIIYVETTRSRVNSQLQPVRKASLEYYRMNNLWVLPMEVHGVERICPPEEPFHFLEKTDAYVRFGVPFSASWLKDCHLPETLAGRAVRRADLLTAKIAVLNRSMVDSEDMEYYNALLKCDSMKMFLPIH